MRDYRKCAFYQVSGDLKNNGCPVVKVCLKMSLENIVKDIPLISNNAWTYGDLMVSMIGTSYLATKLLSCIGVNFRVVFIQMQEVESRILKALQPQLHLDPTPKLDRLCNNPVPTKVMHFQTRVVVPRLENNLSSF